MLHTFAGIPLVRALLNERKIGRAFGFGQSIFACPERWWRGRDSAPYLLGCGW